MTPRFVHRPRTGASTRTAPPPRRTCSGVLYPPVGDDREAVDLVTRASPQSIYETPNCRRRMLYQNARQDALSLCIAYRCVVGPGRLPMITRTGSNTCPENTFEQRDAMAHPSQRPTVSPVIVRERKVLNGRGTREVASDARGARGSTSLCCRTTAEACSRMSSSLHSHRNSRRLIPLFSSLRRTILARS